MNNKQHQPQKPQNFSSESPAMFDYTDPAAVGKLGEWLAIFETDPQEVLRELAYMFRHIQTLADNKEHGYLDVHDFCSHAIMGLYRGTIEFEREADKWPATSENYQVSKVLAEPLISNRSEFTKEQDLENLAVMISGTLRHRDLPEPLYEGFKAAIADFYNSKIDQSEVNDAEEEPEYISQLLRGYKG